MLSPCLVNIYRICYLTKNNHTHTTVYSRLYVVLLYFALSYIYKRRLSTPPDTRHGFTKQKFKRQNIYVDFFSIATLGKKNVMKLLQWLICSHECAVATAADTTPQVLHGQPKKHSLEEVF